MQGGIQYQIFNNKVIMYIIIDQMDVEDEVQQVLEDVQQVLEDYDDASDNNATSDAQNFSDDPVAAENAAENAAGEHLQ